MGLQDFPKLLSHSILIGLNPSIGAFIPDIVIIDDKIDTPHVELSKTSYSHEKGQSSCYDEMISYSIQ